MKYVFATESNPKPKTYAHSFTVTFPKLTKDYMWSFFGKSYATPDDWVEAVRKTLLSVGITDFQVANTTETKKSPITQCRSFYFKNEIDMLQFQSLALPDTKRNFEREFHSPTPAQSQTRQRNVSRFIEENEINAAIVRLSPHKFSVTTGCRQDHVALAIQDAKGMFNTDIKSERQSPSSLPPQALPQVLVDH